MLLSQWTRGLLALANILRFLQTSHAHQIEQSIELIKREPAFDVSGTLVFDHVPPELEKAMPGQALV